MRYFLKGDCSCEEPTEHEVSKHQYVQAEEKAGARHKHSIPGEPSTLYLTFEGAGISGRQMVETRAEAISLLVGCLTSGFVLDRDWKAALQVLGVSTETIEAEETRYWNT